MVPRRRYHTTLLKADSHPHTRTGEPSGHSRFIYFKTCFILKTEAEVLKPEDALSDEEQHPAEITSDPSNRLKLAWLNLCKSFFLF